MKCVLSIDLNVDYWIESGILNTLLYINYIAPAIDPFRAHAIDPFLSTPFARSPLEAARM